MKVAIIYDRVNKWGGAERVLLALHELFPEAPLYTSVYYKKGAKWAKVFKVKTSFLQNFPLASRYHELYPAFMPAVFESFSFDEYDLVISVTSESAKGIIVGPNTLHICYCLTPTRYLWSGYEDYFRNQILRVLAKPVIFYLRYWDTIAARKPDIFIAISHEVKERIKKYYKRDSMVIYPPITLASRNQRLAASSQKNTSKPYVLVSETRQLNANNYFLVVSRLISFKNIDVVIQACNTLKMPLKIVGVGSHETALREIAGDTIEFLGSLTDKDLMKYYKGCYGVIIPAHEDFGLVALEAQSFGKPVLAYKAGGSLETVVPGKTGEFFYPLTEKALIKKLQEFQKKKYSQKECKNQAKRFTKEQFKKQLLAIIEESLQRKKLNLPLARLKREIKKGQISQAYGKQRENNEKRREPISQII